MISSPPKGALVDAVWGAQARDGGLVAVLRSFFDETESFGDDKVEGVAAFVFDDVGYDTFRAEWGPRVADLKKPFHVSECYGEYGEFGRPPWSRGQGKSLCRELGNLIARTRLVGFAALITHKEYNLAIERSPAFKRIAGSPYTLCLLHCINLMGKFATDRGQKIFHTFESGHAREAEAEGFLRRTMENETLVDRYAIGGRAFVGKREEPTLCAADYLAWTFQRNWTDNSRHELFKILCQEPRTPIYAAHLSHRDVGVYGMYSHHYNLHSDRGRI